jgi:thymidylate kinase
MSSTGVTGRRRDLPPAAGRVHPTVTAVFEAVEAAGVRWALLRGEARLESPPHDVDLLVASADLQRFLAAVRPLGFVAVPTWARGTHRFFVAFLEELDQWLVLDVVTELSYGPGYAIQTQAAEACLDRRERVGSLSLLSPDDAFWTLLFHCLLDRRDVADHQRQRLRELCPGASRDSMLARFAAGLCPAGWDPDHILAAVGEDEWAALSRLGDQMLRRWRRRHPAAYRVRDLGDRVRWRLAPLHTMIAARGLSVLVAADDAETARRLAASVRDGFYFPVQLLDEHAATGLGRARAATRVAMRLRATYHTARGRVAVATAASASPAPGGVLRPDVVVDVRELHPDERADGHRQLIGRIWRAYGERRGWTSTREGHGTVRPQPQTGSAPRRARVRRGAIVTFSGLDGAGKSSQALLLKEALERQGIDTAIEWVPVAINPSLEHMKAAGKRLIGLVPVRERDLPPGGQQAAALDPGKRLVRRSPLARHVWSSIVTLLNVVSHWRMYLRHRVAGNVVIFDRYSLDSAVRLDTWYGDLGSVDFQVWLIRTLSPRPLCSYFLDVQPERALARKTEQWDLAMLTRQAELYRSQCRRFGVRRLDGERSREDLANEIADEVLDRLGRSRRP